MDSRKNNIEDSPRVIRMQRRRTLRVTLILTGLLLMLIGVTNIYVMELLQMNAKERHDLVLCLAIGTVIVGPFMAFWGIRWARPLIQFGRIVSSGRQPTTQESLETISSVVHFPMKLGALMMASYLVATAVVSVLLYYHFHFSPWESGQIAIVGAMVTFDLGVVMYYAVKLQERVFLEKAAGILFEKGQFEFQHLKLTMRTKLLAVIFMVVFHILVSSVLMGFAQVSRVQRAQLEENLLSIARQNTEREGVSTGKSGIFILDKNGDLVTGPNANISPAEIKYMLASRTDGVIRDEKSRKMIAFSALSQDGIITGAIGFWGQTAGALRGTRKLIIELMLATFLLCMLATYLVVNDIDLPLRRTVDYLERLWSGEDVRSLKAYSDDEMGMLVGKVMRTTQALKERTRRSEDILAAVRIAISLITDTTQKLLAITADQATGASEQVTIVQQVVSTTNEIAATASNIADATGSVNQAAQKTSEVCNKGRDYIGSAISGMNAIQTQVERITEQILNLSGQAEQIGGVVKIIREISEQTNLLALNAALEAAGAGDSGRRFDVVAKEVRRLANRTLESTEYIKNMIQNIQKSASNMVIMNEEQQKASAQGTQLVEQMGEYFRLILEMVETTRRSASEISLITKQQATASDQLVTSLNSVEQVAHEVSKGGTEIESLTDELKTLSDNLQVQVGEKVKNAPPLG